MPNVASGVVDLVSRPIDFLSMLRAMGLVRPSMGSQPFKWNLQSAGSSDAEIYVEGQSAPTPTAQTYQQASLAPFYLQTAARVTGHVLDNIAKGGHYVDPQQAQLAEKAQALFDLLETTLLGSTQDRGIASIIDADDTYAGIAPGAVSQWASKETNVAGALAISVLEDAFEDVTAAPYNANPSVILAAPNQITNYTRLAGVAGGTTPVVRMMMPGMGGGAFDAGMLAGGGPAFNGIPFARIRGLTTTELYMLDLSPLANGEPGVQLIVHRDLTAKPLGASNDSDNVLLSMAACLKVGNRRRQLKLRGVTA